MWQRGQWGSAAVACLVLVVHGLCTLSIRLCGVCGAETGVDCTAVCVEQRLVWSVAWNGSACLLASGSGVSEHMLRKVPPGCSYQ
jgi:hypothetical protein